MLTSDLTFWRLLSLSHRLSACKGTDRALMAQIRSDEMRWRTVSGDVLCRALLWVGRWGRQPHGEYAPSPFNVKYRNAYSAKIVLIIFLVFSHANAMMASRVCHHHILARSAMNWLEDLYARLLSTKGMSQTVWTRLDPEWQGLAWWFRKSGHGEWSKAIWLVGTIKLVRLILVFPEFVFKRRNKFRRER